MNDLFFGLVILIIFILVFALVVYFSAKVVNEIKVTVSAIRAYKAKRSEGDESDVG